MKFSIIVTSYNKGKYLEKCILSCIAQTYKNFELIIADNYSTDNTRRILNKYRGKINFFFKKRNSYVPAKNQIDLIKHAVKISSGQMICLLDADDFFLQKKLLELRKFSNSNDLIFDIPFVKSQKNIVNKFIQKKKFKKNIWGTVLPTSSISINRKLLNKFISLKFFDKYELLEIDFRINVLAKLFKKKIKTLDPGYNYYCQTPQSIMSNYSKIKPLWWEKRIMAHNYFKKISRFANQKYSRPFDFYVSVIISKILKVIK